MQGVRLGRRLGGALALLVAAGSATAQDRSQYSLFNPPPDHLLRDMTTDRPDTTETPFSIDAGRVQIEATALGYARSRRDGNGAVTDTYEIASTNVRIGLTNWLEAGFVWQPYGIVSTHGGTTPDRRQAGIGGLELRGKINLWGNDTYGKPGSSALGVMPFVVLPTDRDNGIGPELTEGGVIVPLALKLSDRFSLGVNAGIARSGSEGGSYQTEYLASASIGYEWSDTVGTYYEVAARFQDDRERGDEVVLGTGITYRWSKDVQLDAGVNIGATPAADRINPFIGVSVRY